MVDSAGVERRTQGRGEVRGVTILIAVQGDAAAARQPLISHRDRDAWQGQPQARVGNIRSQADRRLNWPAPSTATAASVASGAGVPRSEACYTWRRIRSKPGIRTFSLRLRAGGKHPKPALTACLRKLLVILDDMLRTENTGKFLRSAPASAISPSWVRYLNEKHAIHEGALTRKHPCHIQPERHANGGDDYGKEANLDQRITEHCGPSR
jgi:hypothetical protein